MKKLKLLVSLVNAENEYQLEQARGATDAAAKFGADVKVVYADGDAILQGQQLLDAIQSPPNSRPDAIVCHPAGTGLTQVAQAAAAAGIGWAIVNREVDYLGTLRASTKAPVFCVTVDQREVGHIQARQMAALLPKGGLVLYIQGTSGNFSADERTHGMQTMKPANAEVRMIRGRFTEESGYRAAKQWLSLATSRQTRIELVSSQNDAMALGARKAIEEEGFLRPDMPFTGCDASGTVGQERVRNGILTASIALPNTAGLAIETFATAFQTGIQPSEQTVLKPTSLPPIEHLSALLASAARR